MWPYWLIFLIPACLSLAAPSAPLKPGRGLEPSWLFIGVALALMVGLRYQVGGDWFSYEEHYANTIGLPLEEVIKKSDPGYYLLIWLSTQFDGGIYFVNTVFGVLFAWGITAFCRSQPRPWLALAVATPYMIIVVAMGYSRQGVALGLAMLGMTRLGEQKNLQFVLCVVLAATFHKSAVLLVPLAALATPRGRIWTGLWVSATLVSLYWLFLADSVDNLISNYIDAEYESQGAAVRIFMNALPALILLVFRKRFTWSVTERNLWVMMSLAALATLVMLKLSPSSTAVDRVALYLIPLQLFVFSRLPDLWGYRGQKRYWVTAVILFYAAVQFVWLNYAANAKGWIPYQFYPMVDM